MSTGLSLTTTSYAVLGLLAVKPWTTYELVRQVEFSLRRFWPRAQSKLYEEPKKLVAHGLATAREETVGRRPRTVYTITARGRRALAQWLAEPGAGPSLEFEGLLKLIFSEHGSREDALASIAHARAWAVEQNAFNISAARAFLAGEGQFGARAPQTMLAGAFLTDFYGLVARWADWAEEQVSRWPRDMRAATADKAELRAVLHRAEWSIQPDPPAPPRVPRTQRGRQHDD